MKTASQRKTAVAAVAARGTAGRRRADARTDSGSARKNGAAGLAMKARAATAKRSSPTPPNGAAEEKIRELTRTLQIVEEARANLADQYDYAPIGFFTLDEKGCVREMNLTAARMLGRNRGGMLTMPFFPHAAKGQVSAFLRHLRLCRKRRAEVVTEMVVRTRTGTVLPVELRSVPVVDARGAGTVYRTAMTDITERRRIAADLRQSEQQHRDLVEFSPDGIFIECDEAIAFANGAAARLCGVGDAGELIGQGLVDFVRRIDRRSVILLLGQKQTSPDAPRFHVKFLRRDGTSVEVELAARPFVHRGEPAVLVVARDISRRRAAERQVLAISDRERARFGRDLHDGISQSLMAVSFRAEALRNRMRATNAEVAEEADQIAGIARNCMKEARNLARGLCPVAMEKHGLVAALQELSAEVARHGQVECALDCDETLAIGDVNVATNIYRITQEAVANAIKHGGAQTVIIRLAAQDGKTTLQVRDDGKGISAKPRQSGMGLHTMHYRATMLGGSLEVGRAGARGTLVTCIFPTNGEAP